MDVPERTGFLTAVAAGVTWGFLGFFVRSMSSAGFTPVQMTCLRYIVVFAVFLAFILARHRRMLIVSRRMLGVFAVMGVVGNLINSTCYFEAMERIPISLATIIQYLMPFMVVLASVPLFGERITRDKGVSLVVAFIGCILCTGIASSDVPLDAVGIVLAVASAVFYGTYTLCSRKAVGEGYSTPTIMLYSSLFCFVFALPFSDPAEMMSLTFSSAGNLLMVLGLGVLVTLVPFALYNVGISRIGAGRAAIITYTEPMTAAAVGLALYGEPVTVWTVIGMAMILISIVVLNRSAVDGPSEGRHHRAGQNRYPF